MNLKVNYGEKLFDPRWIAVRKRILERDKYMCKNCQKTDIKLQVHHRQYHFIKRLNMHVDPWNYADKFLITLCESCHSRGHRLFEIPIKYI